MTKTQKKKTEPITLGFDILDFIDIDWEKMRKVNE
jgi:hypothetical protein